MLIFSSYVFFFLFTDENSKCSQLPTQGVDAICSHEICYVNFFVYILLENKRGCFSEEREEER